MLDENRLDRLISAYLDRSLAEDEKTELETMLLGSARAREIFHSHTELHGLTRQWALQNQTALLMADPPMRKPSAKLPARRTATPPKRKNIIPFRALAIGAGIAACSPFAWKMLSREAAPVAVPVVERKQILTDDVALLGEGFDVKWAPGAAQYVTGSPLPKGPLKIDKGTLRIDFYSGARVFLEGPATLELVSPALADLTTGRLIARVPPPAENFTITSGDLRVIDRGTEFGVVTQASGEHEVHVFEGRVDLQGAVPASGKASLVAGEAGSIAKGMWTSMPADRTLFSDPDSMRHQADRATEANWAAWRVSSAKIHKMQGLLVYYDFEGIDPASMLIRNRAAGAQPSSNGSGIGCELLTGRWKGKSALGFISTSDRVRFRMAGQTMSLTLTASIRVDSLPRNHNSLFSMSPDVPGEVHWKIDEHGFLLVGVRAAPEFDEKSWERLDSPAFLDQENFGRWMRITSVIDGTRGEMRHYLNGREIAKAPMKRRPYIQLGLANIGNFDEADKLHPTFNVAPTFNGRIDEFAVFNRALTAREIEEMR